MNVKCSKCGTEFNSNFCPNCGTPRPGTTQANDEWQAKSRRDIMIALGIIGSVILLAVILFIASSIKYNQQNYDMGVAAAVDSIHLSKDELILIGKTQYCINNEHYEDASELLADIKDPVELINMTSVLYTSQYDFASAANILLDYCSSIKPLASLEDDPLYNRLLDVYEYVPDQQENIDLLKHSVHVDKVGYEAGHDWSELTCTDPRICKVCGEKSGKALGHDYEDATCLEAKKCKRCGARDGFALGHEVEEWKLTQKPTCAEYGIEVGTCARCGEEVHQNVDKVEHTPGEWKITRETTSAKTPGEKSLLCKVCGEVMEKEPYTITEAEEKKIYESQFESVSYDTLARYPDTYKGKKVKIKVTIVDEGEENIILYKPIMGKMGGKEIAIHDTRELKEPRLKKGDTVTIYGEGDGTATMKEQRVGILWNKTVDKYEVPMVKVLSVK